MKKYQALLAVLLVVLVAVLAVVATGVAKIKNQPAPPADEQGSDATKHKSYVDEYALDTAVNLPLLKTDFENVFFTMTQEGEVQYYTLENGRLSPMEETGSFRVTAACSGQDLPAEVHYIEKDGATFGAGLFTNLLYPDVMIYDYAFFKVTSMYPQARSETGARFPEGTLLMLLDVDSTRFYSNEKVYSEIFALSADKKSTVHYLSEDQRTVNMDARLKTDYKMFTDDILTAAQPEGANVLFFSSRYYADYSASGKTDIFTSGGSGTNTDNLRYVMDVDGLYFWRTEDGTRFFRDNADGSFSLKMLTTAGDTLTLETFPGSLGDDYFVRGRYLFSKKTGVVWDVTTLLTRQVYYGAFRSGFEADLFEISENGQYAVVRGKNTWNTPACGIMDFTTGEIVAYTDDVFGYLAAVNVLNDGTVVLSTASGESGSSYYQLISANR